jgi:tetratricopeptide (TPR) repeat protein
MNAGRFIAQLLLIVTLLLAGHVQAQSHFDAESHLQQLNAALAENRFLDAYDEFFQINDSSPAAVKAIYESDPQTDVDRVTQAFFFAQTGRADDALAAVDSLPESVSALLIRAVATNLLDQQDVSDAALTQAVDLADDDAQFYGLIANAAFVHFDVERMMTYSTHALEIQPDLALALRAHALANLLLGELPTALADSSRGLELDPEFYGFHTLRANIFMALGQPDDAHAELDAALALNPDSSVANGIRSRVNAALGNMEAATRDFAAAVNVKTVEIVDGGALSLEESTSATMTLGRTFHLAFDGEQDQTVTLSVTSDIPGAVDPTLLLLSPEGVPLTFNDDAGDDTMDASIEGYALPESGTYTIVVSYANGGSEGDLTVSVVAAQ